MSEKLDEFALHLLLENYISDKIGNSTLDSSERFLNHLKVNSNLNEWSDAVNAGIQLLKAFNEITLHLKEELTVLVQPIVSQMIQNNKKVIILGGVNVPGINQGHAICWMLDIPTSGIWLANSGEGIIKNHKQVGQLWNTIKMWKALDNEAFKKVCSQILFATYADQRGKLFSNNSTQGIYDNVINKIDIEEYKLPLTNESGTLGQYKWIIQDGYFYSESQITGTCTFHSMMWILYVNMNMKYDLMQMFRKQELNSLNNTSFKNPTFPDYRNCLRLIYKLYNSNETKLLNLKKFLSATSIKRVWKKADINPINVNIQSQEQPVIKKYNRKWTIKHIEQINLIQSEIKSKILINQHIISMSIEVMSDVIKKSKVEDCNWIEMLKKMTNILAVTSDLCFNKEWNPKKLNNPINQQFEDNFYVTRIQLVVRMFEINEFFIDKDYKLPRIESNVELWPRLYSGRLIEIGNVRLLNKYSGYLFDPKNANKKYDNSQLKKENTEIIMKMYWRRDKHCDVPAHMTSFCKFVGSNIVTVCLMTAYTFLMVPDEKNRTFYENAQFIYLAPYCLFHFKHVLIDWDGSTFKNKCDEGVQSEIMRFEDMYFSTNLVQGNLILDDMVSTPEKLIELMNVSYDTCNDETPEVVISTNWYINYKTHGKWIEKRQEIERKVYIKIVSQVETCKVSALLFYIVKILQHHSELTTEFKTVLCTKIQSRKELDEHLVRVVCAILLNESLSPVGIVSIFEQTEPLNIQMMTLQACILLYLKCCSNDNYNTFLSIFINMETNGKLEIKASYNLDSGFIINEINNKNYKITASQIHRTANNAILTERPSGTQLEQISTMLDAAKIKHIFWNISNEIVLDIPILKYVFKMLDKTLILRNQCTEETWTVKWVHEVPCSVRDWGYNVHQNVASFFIENTDKVLGVIYMHAQGKSLRIARTVFDKNKLTSHLVTLTNNSVYLQFAANLCMPIFTESSQVYFVGAVCISGGNMRCIQTLFTRLQYANIISTDPFEKFVAMAYQNECIGTAFYPLLIKDLINITRRRFSDVSIDSIQTIIEIPLSNPIDSLLSVYGDTPYPTLNIDRPYDDSHLKEYKDSLASNLSKLDEMTFAECVDFHPSCKVAWLVSVIRATEKALLLKTKYERFALVKHLHSYWVDLPSTEDEFVAISGKFISKKQTPILKRMKEKLWDKTQSKIYQEIMGIGKSNVIMPLLVHHFLTSALSVVVVQPPHLVKAASYILFSFIPYSHQREVKIINHDELHDSNKQWVLVISDAELKKIILNAHMIQDKKMLSAINTAIVLMDEIDETSNPLRSELNITTGDYVAHPLEIKDIDRYYSKIYLASIQDKDEKLFDLGDDLNNKITKDVQSCLALRYNMDYGKSRDGGFSVPYRGVNTPVEGASFSDPEIKHILTCMTKYKSGLVLADIAQFRKACLHIPTWALSL
jgi:hypothetical protein